MAAARVRRSIDDPANAANLESYRHALAKLREVSSQDPESKDGYDYFAALHDDIEVGPCEHGRNTFLPWHRAHLFEFEEALRRSDPPRTADVTIPYWDWSELPSGRRYALAFEDAASVLFDPSRRRDPVCSPDGPPGSCVHLPFPRSYLEQTVLGVPNWSGTGSNGFAGESAGESDCRSHSRAGFGALESPPHNTMHGTFIGGSMASPDTAAQDPIFWSFHTYIDLLWWQWQTMGGHHEDGGDFLEWRLCGLYRDRAGMERYQVKDTLSVEAMGYAYDYRAPTPLAPALAGRELPAYHPALDIVVTAQRDPDNVQSIDVTLPEGPVRSATLLLRGIRLNNPFTYEGDIFLVPREAAFQPRGREFRRAYLAELYYIWRGHVHGHGHHGPAQKMDLTVDLMRQVRQAQARGWRNWRVVVAVAPTEGRPDTMDILRVDEIRLDVRS